MGCYDGQAIQPAADRYGVLVGHRISLGPFTNESGLFIYSDELIACKFVALGGIRSHLRV